jgi:hypothetical protein
MAAIGIVINSKRRRREEYCEGLMELNNGRLHHAFLWLWTALVGRRVLLWLWTALVGRRVKDTTGTPP